MTRFIYKYLSAYFAVKFGKILPQNRNSPYYYEVDNLIEDLSTVFGLTKKQLKYYIKGWARKQDRNFDFKEWWSPTPEPVSEDGFPNIAFPMVRRVMAQTIANDLVAVQPLEAPRGMLFYLDYRVEGEVQRVDEPNQNGRVYPREQFQNALENAEQNNRNERIQQRPIGELDHPEGGAVARFMNQWAALSQNQTVRDNLNQLYRNQLAHLQRPV